MPNWCQNVMFVTHQDKDKLQKIIDEAKKGELFQYLIPEKRDCKNNPIEGWYDWRCNHWGTKWDIRPINFEEENHDEQGIFSFDDFFNEDDVDRFFKFYCESSNAKEKEQKIYIFKFDTAWSPPIPVYKKMFEMGFKFQAFFVEYGVEYEGSFINGKEYQGSFPNPRNSKDEYISNFYTTARNEWLNNEYA
tara:strand:- start:261 stop:833 length:573 start_codon:yes stop_codon:yes gene_type:complete